MFLCIKFLDPKVTPPVASAHSDFHLKGFTANWEAVEGADSYLVSLYTINADRDKTRNYIVKDRPLQKLQMFRLSLPHTGGMP